MDDWLIYEGDRTPHDGISRLPAPPPWRTFGGTDPLPTPAGGSGDSHGAQSYRPGEALIRQVNAALYLRRPLLVTGPPGTGKSTLAYAVAHELKLGPVLHWPITSRVSLPDGLYQYDPLTRLYAAGSAGGAGDADATSGRSDVGDYIRLGPLGTALLPYRVPRVLLIDEIDKGDIDLPNDLLTVFEKGSYEIVELARLAEPTARVMSADRGADRVEIRNGVVTCDAFPLVIMTSNGDRAFPPAFLRRCVTVELKHPQTTRELSAIVSEHLGGVLAADGTLPEQANRLIEHFFQRRSRGLLANDQLLNAIFLCHHATLDAPPADVLALADQVMPYLSTELDPSGH